MGNSTFETELPVQKLQARATQVYGRQNQQVAQERRILEFLPLVKHVVHKVASGLSRGHDLEDLISAGTLGLVKAAQAFDPARDVEFKTYAYIRIRGAVLDELRTRSPVSPKVLKQILYLRKCHSNVQANLGRQPSDEELAAEAGISLEQLYRTLTEARRQHFLSINGMGDEQPALGKLAPLDKQPSPEDQAQRKELRALLAKAIMELPTRDRHVLLLYYKEDLTMKEIAQVLQVTEPRVSQIHASALFKLSTKLNPPEEPAE